MRIPRVWQSSSLLVAATLTFVLIGGTAITADGKAATVSKTEVEDSFFNQCTGEQVDRTYTQHITRRKYGEDYVLAINWSNGKGVGQKTGDRYTMQWKYQQVNQENENNDQQSYTYRIKTKVQAQGSASDYTSTHLVKLRMNADGEVEVEQAEASGIECS